MVDLRDECGRHSAPGGVVQVKVPRPPQQQQSAQLFGTGNYGKVREAIRVQAWSRGGARPGSPRHA